MKNQETLLNAIETLQDKIIAMNWQINDIKSLIGKPETKPIDNELGLFPADIAGEKQVGKYRQKLNPTDKLVLKELSRGHFVAMPTVAGSIGRGRLTVAESIKVLRNLNYNVITKTVSGTGRRYRKIYKIEGKLNNA